MKLRDEMIERMKASFELRTESGQDVFTGWRIESEVWSGDTEAAVGAVMTCVNTLAEMVLRLAEAIDELRDAPDV